MGFDLPTDLEARVARYAERERITADEALREIVEDGLRRRETRAPTPAQQMIGLFSSDEDTAIMNDVVGMAYKDRKRRRSGQSA